MFLFSREERQFVNCLQQLIRQMSQMIQISRNFFPPIHTRQTSPQLQQRREWNFRRKFSPGLILIAEKLWNKIKWVTTKEEVQGNLQTYAIEARWQHHHPPCMNINFHFSSLSRLYHAVKKKTCKSRWRRNIRNIFGEHDVNSRVTSQFAQ